MRVVPSGAKNFAPEGILEYSSGVLGAGVCFGEAALF